MSKAAMNMLVAENHARFSPKGVKVFAFCPGFVVSNLRGESEEERSGWGYAGSATQAGETMLRILKGERDSDVGKLLHKDGVYGW